MLARYKKRSNLFQIVVSYLLIIIPLIIVNAIIYYMIFVANYEEELSNVNKKSLLQMKMVVDNMVTVPIFEVFSHIAFDTKNVGYFDPIYEQDKVYEMWAIYKVHQDLLALKKKNVSLFHSINIYYSDSKFVNSSSSFKYVDQHTSSYVEFEWLKHIDFIGTTTSFASHEPRLFYNNEKDEVITILRTLLTGDAASDKKAIVAINIYKSYIDDILNQNIVQDIYQFNIYHKNGNSIYSTKKDWEKDNAVVKELLSAKRLSSHKVSQVKVNDLIHSFVLSDDNDFVYTFTTPKSNYFEKSSILKKQIVFMGIAMLVISSILVYIKSKKIYRPISELVKQAKNSIDLKKDRDVDDYQAIDVTIQTLTKKINGLNRTLDTYIPNIKNNFYTDLIQNTISINDIKNKQKFLDIRFVGPYYKVLIVFFSKLMSISEIELLCLGIMEYTDHLNYKGLNIYNLIRGKHEIVMICNYKDCLIYDQMVSQLYVYITKNLGLGSNKYKCKLCSGKSYSDIENVYKSYAEAKEMNKYTFIYDNMMDYDKDGPFADIKAEEIFDPYQLKGLINTMNRNQLESYIQDTVYQMKVRKASYETVQLLLSELVSKTKQFLQENSLRLPSDIVDTFVADYKKMVHLDEFNKIYSQLIKDVLLVVETRKETSKSELVESILTYIEKHIDKEICLRDLADCFHVSYSYLSKIIKEETGKTYSQLLVIKRIHHANKLLKETNLTVEQISGKVGFKDAGYFIKQYKKIKGVTPGYYRKNLNIERYT
ncbi:MAG: AraC family transcriptional regulator [Firmicutes bacterium]|nr:AraC family transcriptional regulator [Bacillota bacterium]